MDCWERERGVGQFEDQDKFLKQCRLWWAAVPTVYRRDIARLGSYWSSFYISVLSYAIKNQLKAPKAPYYLGRNPPNYEPLILLQSEINEPPVRQ